MMPYDVIEARHVGGFVLWLRFRDGTVGEIDLTAELHGPVFEPLRDPATFRAFQVHPEFHTVTWPNGLISRLSSCTTTSGSRPNPRCTRRPRWHS